MSYRRIYRKDGRIVSASRVSVKDGSVTELDITGVPAEARVSGATWPMECYASGVHPEQAGQLRKHFSDAGIRVEVSANGNPIYESMEHRRKALKSRGIFDKDSYV